MKPFQIKEAEALQQHQVPLPELPDEMVLEVLRLLSPRDLLFGARAVCRRWRDLALHRALWNRQQITVTDENADETCAVLRLAPCLGALTIGPGDDDPDHENPVCHPIAIAFLASCDCPVGRLTLRSHGDSRTEVTHLRRALRRQAKLGQLKRLDLDVSFDTAVSLFLEVWDAGLVELKLVVVCFGPRPLLPALPIPPRGGATLKRLSYEAKVEGDIVTELVRAHATTLVSVKLHIFASVRAVKLLAGCVLLTEAQVPFRLEVSCLSQCQHLTDLTLLAWFGFEAMPTPLLDYFKSAIQLVRLSFRGSLESFEDGQPEHSASLLAALVALVALGSSGGAALEELCLSVYMERDVLDALPGLLSGLPRLHSLLVMTAPSQEVLQSIAPRLRLFGFDFTSDGHYCNIRLGGLCTSSVCSLPFLVATVRSNPGLHVSGLRNHFPCSRPDCDCCKEGLHPQGPRSWWQHFSLYGHDPAMKCGLPLCRREACSVFVDGKCGCLHEWRFVGLV